MTDFDLIKQSIEAGDLDSQIDELKALVDARKRVTVANGISALKAGDRVRVGGNIRPKYLWNTTGTLIGFAGKRALVRVDQPERYLRFTRDGIVRFPVATLRRVS